MAKIPVFKTRLAKGQDQEIAQARAIWKAAKELRDRATAKAGYNELDVNEFWNLIEKAGASLHASNPELGERAGLGASFFTSVPREKRRPRLQNYLSALNIMIDVAAERLSDVDYDSSRVKISHNYEMALSAENTKQFADLATALALIATQEIERVEAQRPNDPDSIVFQRKALEVLALLLDGLTRIAAALSSWNDQHELLQAKAAQSTIGEVSLAIQKWWRQNNTELIDWSIRLPILSAGIALLKVAGADMTVGTTAVAALVGGAKMATTFRSRKGR